MNTGHASHWGRRSVLFAVGINVLAIGTALFACCGLGVSALVAVPEVLSLLLPVTLGQMTTVFFIILVIIELCLLRSFRWRVIAQMGVALVFGWIVDFYGLTIGLGTALAVLLVGELISVWEKLFGPRRPASEAS